MCFKDTNVAKILKLRLNDINKRVRRTKEHLLDLRGKRNELKVLLAREERRRKDTYPISRGSSISRTSVSYDKFTRRGQMNESYFDDLNESFVSITTSVTKSPMHRDRYNISSNDTSVDGRFWRDNRFAPAKKPTKNYRTIKKSNEPTEDFTSASHSIHVKETKETNDTQNDDIFKDVYPSATIETNNEPIVFETSPTTRGYALSFADKRQELKKADTFGKFNEAPNQHQNVINLFKSGSQEDHQAEDDSIPFYSEINSFGPNVQDQLRKVEYEQSYKVS